MRIKELVEKAGYEMAGNEELLVQGIKWFDCAGENEIAICHSEKEIECTKAEIILTDCYAICIGKTVIYTGKSVETAAVKIANVLIKEKQLKDYAALETDFVQKGTSCYGNDVVIGENTVISPFCTIESGVTIGSNCYIGSNTVIKRDTCIGNYVTVGSGTVIGADSFYHYVENNELKEFAGVARVIVKDKVFIGNQCVLQRGVFRDTEIGACTKIGNLVDIGHDVVIGENCKIVSQTGIAGNAVLGNRVCLYGQVGVVNHVKIMDGAVVMAKSRVTKNVPAGKKVSGMYSREHIKELKIQASLDKRNGG